MTITEETIRRLASFTTTERPVVSVYLDVDGRRWPKYRDCEARIERMVKGAVDLVMANGHAAAVDDLRRIESHVKGGVDRSTTRGLALFASAPDLWQVFELPVRVRDQIVVNETPHVSQLESAVQNHERFGVLLANRQRARMFVFQLGQLVERSELFDALPRHDDDAGGADRRHDRAHVDAAAHHHLKHAAQAAFQLFKEAPFDHLIVGGPVDIVPELEADLHQYLKQRIAARLDIAVSASEAEVRTAALEVEERIERAKEAALVERLRTAAGANKGGVAGLEGVLRALGERRVDTLLVSEGYEAPGWRCGCRRLAIKGPTCPDCARAMTRADDVVECAVEEALRQACHVDMCVANADLDVLGRIGALLRY